MTDQEILEAMRHMLTPLQTEIQGINHRLDAQDARMQGIEHKLDAQDARIQGIEHKLDAQDTRIQGIEHKLEAQKTELLSGVQVLMETMVQTQINLLAEDIQIIRERMPDSDDLEAMDARLSAVEAVVRKHSKDIQTLKKAQ